jgi:hypothetical protein
MPRRELLTSLEREQLFALPRDDGALLRIATLSREDLAFIGQHRGDHNRSKIASPAPARLALRAAPRAAAPSPPRPRCSDPRLLSVVINSCEESVITSYNRNCLSHNMAQKLGCRSGLKVVITRLISSLEALSALLQATLVAAT